MVKVRYLNLLLVLVLLLLLVISCNLKTQGDSAQGYLPGKSPFKNPVLTGHVEGFSPRLRKRDTENAHGASVVEEGNEVKFNKLLDTFKLQGKGKELIEYVRRAVTDPGIGTSGDKTYTDLEFYNLLVGFGDVKVKEIIQNNLVTFEELNEALRVINTVKGEKLRSSVNFLFGRCTSFYKAELKSMFSRSTPDAIYNGMKEYQSAYLNMFTKFKFDVRGALEGEVIYAGLADDKRAVIDYMQVAVTDPGIGTSGDKTYTNTEFYQLLGVLGDEKVNDIGEVHLETVKELNEALRVITDVKGEKLRSNLDFLFGTSISFYSSELKSMFSRSTPDAIYNGIKDHQSTYLDVFTKLKVAAEGTLKGEVIYAGLPSAERSVIDYIQSIVTNPDIGTSNNKTYTDLEFYQLLGVLGYGKVSKIGEIHLETVGALNEALRVINSVQEEESKKDLKNRLDVEEESYTGLLKQVFSEDAPDSVYTYATVDYGSGRFIPIIDDAKRIVAAS
ncbi:Hypothetical protein BHY_1138 (plasmid) [Borrelia nietonii YOR]|uniref:Uncharacterized protein n=1 Tax=Borrelia nietonii YOR TaxID=1293576 RepID=W5SAF5_9SPIR|nr:hypothetical protein [Borrelia nietonii]AHH04089.1 Hypothetical protein BHY_1138 [Borrelia nietonii YOR]UPA09909.1 hypothetical protein bhYOR_001224 [Borrelia nietonii YOR]